MIASALSLVWFMAVACALSIAAFVVFGHISFKQSSGQSDPVVIRDELGPSSHHLYGMLMVPQTCDELQERVQFVSPVLYEIVFNTWQEPSVPCTVESTPRTFHAAVFAPAVGVEFVATYQGAALPITVVPSVPAH